MMLQDYLASQSALVDRALDAALPPETAKPATIHKAMRYSLFAGGKRLRPVLCLAAAEACAGNGDAEAARQAALPAACAVECVHTYSLIHDDLPCMDNDDLRRGRPTSHKVFGEGMAVLAGDALLTVAFGVLAQAQPLAKGVGEGTAGHDNAAPGCGIAPMIAELARASGSLGMIAGQVADLEGEGKPVEAFPLEELRFIHESKTAALLTAALRLGGMSAGAAPGQLEALTQFGRNLGLAFQVIDDILDVTQTSEKLGKSAGKDVAAQKATYPALLGLDASRQEAARLTEAALNALAPFGEAGEALRAIGRYLLEREY